MYRNLTLIKMDYHRNGVSGVGFHVALFFDNDPNGDGKKAERVVMLGVLFDNDNDCYCCAFSVSKLADMNIAFGENSFRGDYYVDAMRKWSKAFDEEE